METETLCSYEQGKDKHILNDNMDDTSRTTESDLHQTKVYDGSSKITNNDIGLYENKLRRELENNAKENELINTTDNDQDDHEEVTDEEEDVPLNLGESKSDNENLSDDDLDDLDTFPNEDHEDSDKEENENESTTPSKDDVKEVAEDNIDNFPNQDNEVNDKEENETTTRKEIEVEDVKEFSQTEESKKHVIDSNDVGNEDVATNNIDIVDDLPVATSEIKDKEDAMDKMADVEKSDTSKNDEFDSIETTNSENDKIQSMNIEDPDSLEKNEPDLPKVTENNSLDKSESSSNNEEQTDEKKNDASDQASIEDNKSDETMETSSRTDKNDIVTTTKVPLALGNECEAEAPSEKPDVINEESNKPLDQYNSEKNCVEKNHEDCEDNINYPLLKESLSKPSESKQNEGDDDIDMDEDFDPSLLCPDIAMEVDEAPVITSDHGDSTANDGNKSPLLYEPIFSTFVDEVTGAEISFDLTPEEEHKRQETYGQHNPVHLTKVHCTACNIHLGSALDGQGNRFVHPLLKVLICKKCYHFYTSGEFEKDEDGSELYCRWCGQGGQVMCCANCEMVFCKKCIRINFDRKKIAQIRDSDDWLCFRCHPSQITHLKLHCAEFMEYVRRETSRVATLDNAADFMKIDHCRCCIPQKKKAPSEASGSQPAKKKKVVVDPDYDPYKDRESPKPSTSGFSIDTSKSVPITPKESDPNKNGGIVQVNRGTTNISILKSRNMSSLVKPKPPVVAPGTINSSNTNFVNIIPSGIRLSSNKATVSKTTTNLSARNPVRPNRLNNNTNMKHEWFEKTVRAAARVNSNLSYTLTQLNRAQATASSVEALAVVHNKLQEILSTSINSLIQIRKNLRTEFIQGIKNIRFPTKPNPPPLSSSSSHDDDVIFISPPSSPVPPPLIPTVPKTTVNQSLPSFVPNLGPEISIRRNKSSVAKTITKPDTPVVTTSKGELERPKTFLRVKSLTALQNVPSECITIPDDPPSSTTVNKYKDDDVTIIEDTPEDDIKSQLTNGISNGQHHQESNKKDTEVLTHTVDALDKPHSKEVQRLTRMTVVIHKSAKIDEMVRNFHGYVNGDAPKKIENFVKF